MTLGIYFDASAVLDHDKKFSGVPFGELITKGSEMYGCRGCSANNVYKQQVAPNRATMISTM